jgi:hypothetical protein
MSASVRNGDGVAVVTKSKRCSTRKCLGGHGTPHEGREARDAHEDNRYYLRDLRDFAIFVTPS